jgi:WD40 repeat protein
VVFSPDGKKAFLTPEGKFFKLWDIAAGRELHTFAGHTEYVSSVAFSPDGKWALSGSVDKTLKLWEVSTGQSY